jgi:hypothetical protein
MICLVASTPFIFGTADIHHDNVGAGVARGFHSAFSVCRLSHHSQSSRFPDEFAQKVACHPVVVHQHHPDGVLRHSAGLPRGLVTSSLATSWPPQ